jgi:hypothetical protein
MRQRKRRENSVNITEKMGRKYEPIFSLALTEDQMYRAPLPSKYAMGMSFGMLQPSSARTGVETSNPTVRVINAFFIGAPPR